MLAESLVSLRCYMVPVQAQLAAAHLRYHHIRCQVAGETASTSLGCYGPAVSKIDLLVGASDALRADEVLSGLESPAGTESTEQVNWTWKCDQCGEWSPASFSHCWSCDVVSPRNPERVIEKTPPTHMVVGQSFQAASSGDSPFRAPVGAGHQVILTPQHDLVRRTTRAAVLALFLPPLAWYSLYLTVQCFRTGTPPLRVYAALALSLLMAPVGCVILLPIM